MRALSDKFMKDLRHTDGLLHPLLERIKQDHTLLLSIRKNYINIYYRGGNIIKIKEKLSGGYSSYFNPKYNKVGIPISTIPSTIIDKNDTNLWLDAFQILKKTMDCYFSMYRKLEREFQQLIARDNNHSKASVRNKYFVSDIEFTDTEIGARFDILALKWLNTYQKIIVNFRPALIEMKYGDRALKGNSGIIEHLVKFDAFIADKGKYQKLLETMESQFNQLAKLGMIEFNRVTSWKNFKVDSKIKPEVIFILTNHNPHSKTLGEVINCKQIDDFANSSDFDLRFHVSRFSGYALHTECMVSLEEFRKLVKYNKSVT